MTAFFVYKVYFKGEFRIDPPKDEREREAKYLDEEISVKRAQSGPQ
jgi:hypothetical protein